MYQQFKGSFKSIGITLPMRGLGAKMGPKKQNLKQGDRAKLIPFDSSRRASHFSLFVCQNWMKNGQVLTIEARMAFWARAISNKIVILATFFEI